MRVLLAAPSSPARLHNLVPLAWALRTAGHDVKIAGQPSFVDEILSTGCVAVDVENEEALVDFAKLWRPEVVVSDGPRTAARAVEALAVRLLGPLDEPDAGDADITFDTVPPSLRDATDASPVRHVPYFGPTVVPNWLRRKARRSRILLSLSDVSFFAPVFDAVAEVDAELLCATDPSRIPAGVSMPANVRLVDEAPPAALLPTCAAVVHDGDAALALAAATHGVPQLSLTETAIAARIAASGAGYVGEAGQITDVTSLRANAIALRDEIAALPAPRAVVAQLTR